VPLYHYQAQLLGSDHKPVHIREHGIPARRSWKVAVPASFRADYGKSAAKRCEQSIYVHVTECPFTASAAGSLMLIWSNPHIPAADGMSAITGKSPRRTVTRRSGIRPEFQCNRE